MPWGFILAPCLTWIVSVCLNSIRYLGLTRIFSLSPLKGKVIINVIDSLVRDQREAKAEGEGKSRQPRQTTLAGKTVRHGFTDGKQADLESIDKE